MNEDESDDDADTNPPTACSAPVSEPMYAEPLTVSAVDDAYGNVEAAVVEVAVKYSATASPTTESLAYGEVVPMPTEPFSSTLIIEVDAEFVSSNSDAVPVPEPHTESLEYGVVVPIARKSVCDVKYACVPESVHRLVSVAPVVSFQRNDTPCIFAPQPLCVVTLYLIEVDAVCPEMSAEPERICLCPVESKSPSSVRVICVQFDAMFPESPALVAHAFMSVFSVGVVVEFSTSITIVASDG